MEVAPEGLVIRHNILDRLRPPIAGIIENNIYITETEGSAPGSGNQVVSDPPPPAQWQP